MIMNSLAKECNDIFLKLWNDNKEKIRAEGKEEICIELKTPLGEFEKKNQNETSVDFYLYFYSDENKKYTITFNNTIKQNVLFFDEFEILSPYGNAFDDYENYARIVSANAEAMKDFSWDELNFYRYKS